MLADRVILACTVILTLVYMYATTQIPVLEIGDPLGPKAFPWLLGIAMLVACGFLGAEIWRARQKDDDTLAGEEPQFDRKVVPVLLAIVIWSGCYFLAFEKLGYIVATVIYLLPMMAWFNRGKWIANIASALLFASLTYFLFVELEVRLPQGILPF
ncbi:MAG: tripartite tricarboxylate transporter TctB family protein [Burkholderiales bacterium]|nr:tripartite tricarboxylate transporter TctB family protein [Burkholderiales bacterium]